ncbi:hypothetical protein ACSQ67_014975 [Phaseolus vulgaris]
MNPLRNQLSRFSAFGFKIRRRRKSEKGKKSKKKNVLPKLRRREERIKRGRRRQKRVFKGKLAKIVMSWEGSATCNPTWRNAISVMAECAA